MYKGASEAGLMDTHHYLANYVIEQEIGQGSFATVFLGHEKVARELNEIYLKLWFRLQM